MSKTAVDPMRATPLPAENIWGHTAKLRVILSVLDRLRTQHGRGLRILDVGCGNGWAVTRYLRGGADLVLGIDPHRPSIDYAQSHYGRDGLRFHCATVESLEPGPPGLGVIVLADILEHLADPSSVLRACASLLGGDGRLLVSVPNGYGPFEMESALARSVIGRPLLKATDLVIAALNKYVFRGAWTRAMAAGPSGLPYNDDSPHVQFLTQRGWRRLFAAQGFRVERSWNLAFMSGPFSSYLLGASARCIAANVWMAQRLAPSLVSNWAFELSRCDDLLAG